MRFSAGRYFFEIPDKWKDIAGVRRKGARVDIVLLWEEEPGCSGLLASLKCLKRKIARPDGDTELLGRLRGEDGGMDMTAVTEIADYMEREIGIEISPRQPLVGRHFNVTRAGIHADGMLKDEEIYNVFDTAKILNRPAVVAVDSRGGTASIAHWLNSYFRLTGDNMVEKTDPLIVSMRQQVDAMYAEGRNTVMGDEELEIMVRRYDVDRYEHLLFHKSK